MHSVALEWLSPILMQFLINFFFFLPDETGL